VAAFAPWKYLRRSLSINFRNHRKIVVADGAVAYAGGLNVGVEYTRHWRDLGFRFEGPVAAHFQEVFAEDWYFATGENLAEPVYVPHDRVAPAPRGPSGAVCQIIAGGPDTPHNATHDAFFVAATQARHRIDICTPYLVPDQAIQAALRTAVYRGVDVRVLVPRESDVWLAHLAGRSYYPSLVASGIRIFEYLPSVLHTKLWLIDSDLSVVGSANLDTRSFKLNFEVSCFVRSASLTAALRCAFERDLAESREVTADRLRRVGKWQQLQEAAMNLLSPLL
jgi:cardiolipin synthase